MVRITKVLLKKLKLSDFKLWYAFEMVGPFFNLQNQKHLGFTNSQQPKLVNSDISWRLTRPGNNSSILVLSVFMTLQVPCAPFRSPIFPQIVFFFGCHLSVGSRVVSFPSPFWCCGTCPNHLLLYFAWRYIYIGKVSEPINLPIYPYIPTCLQHCYQPPFNEQTIMKACYATTNGW